jgi:hypothetical protein
MVEAFSLCGAHDTIANRHQQTWEAQKAPSPSDVQKEITLMCEPADHRDFSHIMVFRNPGAYPFPQRQIPCPVPAAKSSSLSNHSSQSTAAQAGNAWKSPSSKGQFGESIVYEGPHKRQKSQSEWHRTA